MPVEQFFRRTIEKVKEQKDERGTKEKNKTAYD